MKFYGGGAGSNCPKIISPINQNKQRLKQTRDPNYNLN